MEEKLDEPGSDETGGAGNTHYLSGAGAHFWIIFCELILCWVLCYDVLTESESGVLKEMEKVRVRFPLEKVLVGYGYYMVLEIQKKKGVASRT